MRCTTQPYRSDTVREAQPIAAKLVSWSVLSLRQDCDAKIRCAAVHAAGEVFKQSANAAELVLGTCRNAASDRNACCRRAHCCMRTANRPIRMAESARKALQSSCESVTPQHTKAQSLGLIRMIRVAARRAGGECARWRRVCSKVLRPMPPAASSALQCL